jgi:hypothetical protein
VPRERKYIFHLNMLNCRLAEGEKLHHGNYRVCRPSKEMQKKKSQRTPRTTTGRVFSSNLTNKSTSYSVALRNKTEEQQQPRTYHMAGPDKFEHRVPAALPKHKQKKTSQSIRVPNINSLSMDKILKVVVTVVQQIMTESNGAMLEEAKVLAITRIVLNPMEQSGI